MNASKATLTQSVLLRWELPWCHYSTSNMELMKFWYPFHVTCSGSDCYAKISIIPLNITGFYFDKICITLTDFYWNLSLSGSGKWRVMSGVLCKLSLLWIVIWLCRVIIALKWPIQAINHLQTYIDWCNIYEHSTEIIMIYLDDL